MNKEVKYVKRGRNKVEPTRKVDGAVDFGHWRQCTIFLLYSFESMFCLILITSRALKKLIFVRTLCCLGVLYKFIGFVPGKLRENST